MVLRKIYQILQYLYFSFCLLIRKQRKLIIIGCGRSGTKFISKLFQEFNIDIRHESLRKNGISSWLLVPNTSKRLLGPSYKNVSILKMPIMHQVRNPLHVISSMQTASQVSWIFISKFIPIIENDSLTLKCMKYWYYWNILAEEKAVYIYRIENIENEIEKIFEIGKFGAPKNTKEILNNISKEINKRQYFRLKWNDLMKIDKNLTNDILSLAKKYGY